MLHFGNANILVVMLKHNVILVCHVYYVLIIKYTDIIVKQTVVHVHLFVLTRAISYIRWRRGDVWLIVHRVPPPMIPSMETGTQGNTPEY